MGVKINLSAEEKVKSLLDLSQSSGIDEDILLSLYILLEDNIFLLFDLLAGHLVRFPSKKKLNSSFINQALLIELTQKSYKVGGVYKGCYLLQSGDEVIINSKSYTVVKEPVTILGHLYIYVKEKPNG